MPEAPPPARRAPAPKPPAPAAGPPRDQELLALARAAGGEADPAAGLAAIAADVAACTRCPLHRTRTKTVPGQGNPRPEIVFVGEGPGADEDRQGLAFIGRAGQVLTRLITAMELTREDVFIANIVKCRPTVDYAMQRDRPPDPDEMHACLPYLRAQLTLLKPRVIVALGATAVFGLLGLKGITSLRGKWFRYQGIDLMPTYHPSYLLRGGAESGDRFWEVWEDMVAVLRRIGRTPPEKKRTAKR